MVGIQVQIEHRHLVTSLSVFGLYILVIYTNQLVTSVTQGLELGFFGTTYVTENGHEIWNMEY